MHGHVAKAAILHCLQDFCQTADNAVVSVLQLHDLFCI